MTMMKNLNSGRLLSVNGRSLSIIVFTLYSAWLLSFTFEGQILYAIGSKYKLDIPLMVFGSIGANFIGLIISGSFIHTLNAAKRQMILSIISAIAGNIIFFFPPTFLWYIILIITSFLAGAFISAWGFFYKRFTPPNGRLKTAAEVLIYSNILMIVLNMLAIHISPETALLSAQILLTAALFFAFKLPADILTDNKPHLKLIKSSNSIKPLICLCLFILIITINSGLMYQVVNPAFAHLTSVVSWYWAVPYILALYIIKNLPEKTNRTYILYVAIAMIGLSFVFFMTLDHSAHSYFIVNTLMLGACGVYDIFWWSILGSMLDFYDNPARVLGVGLSANVLGVLVGGIIGKYIVSMDTQIFSPSVLALTIVFTVLIILPLLHKQLSLLLKNHVFLSPLYELSPGKEMKQVNNTDNLMMRNNLTDREMEIAELLLKGRTYKMIAAELHLSENTIKTHIKNIYSKLNVQNKTELIKLLGKNEHSISG
jgi:DNA-binding CsgD family transcriptional regulator